MGAVLHAVAVIMHSKDWSRSFSSVGIANEQRHVSDRTMRKLQMVGTHIDVGRHLPTLSDLTYIFQRGQSSLFTNYFSQWRVSADECVPKKLMWMMLTQVWMWLQHQHRIHGLGEHAAQVL